MRIRISSGGKSLNFDFIKSLLAATFGIKYQEGSLNPSLSHLQVGSSHTSWLLLCASGRSGVAFVTKSGF